MKLLKKIACSFLTMILITASTVTPVFAAEQTGVVELEATIVAVNDAKHDLSVQPKSTTFIDTAITMSFSSAGMYVSITTGMSMTGSVVGVKDIKIQKKGLFGIWTTVAVSDGAESYNTSSIMVSLNYAGAVEGEVYRVTCTHYGNVDEYRELDHETEAITCWFS